MEACVQDFDEIRTHLIRRSVLLQSNEVPTQSELYGNLGKSLGKVILNNMPLLSKELMGAIDPLKGPNENMRMRPENRLSAKLCLTEASAATKALTHEGVMDIGKDVENKFKHEWLKRLQNALDETSEFEKFEYEKRLKFAIQNEEEKHKRRIDEMNERIRKLVENEYEANLRSFTCGCIDKIKDSKYIQTEETIEDHKEKDDTQIQSKMLEKIVKCLWDDFKEHLRIQKHVITCTNVTEFMHVICAEKLNTQHKILDIKQECKQKLKLQKSSFCVCDCVNENPNDCNQYNKLKQKYTDLVKNFKRYVEYTIEDPDCKEKHKKDPEFEVFKEKIKDDLYNFDKHAICCDCNKSIESIISEEECSEEICSNNSDSTVECKCNPPSSEGYSTDNSCFPSPSNLARRIDWEAIEDCNESEKEIQFPPSSDIKVAKGLVQVIDIKSLLECVCDRLNCKDPFDEIKDKLIRYVVDDYQKVFNENKILEVITCIRGGGGERQSELLAARDSLEIVRHQMLLKGGSKSGSILSCLEDIEEDLESVSDLTLESCEVNERKEEKVKSPKTKSIGVWDSLIKIPKYMIPPNCKVDSSWIYRKTTDEEWDELLRKIKLDEDDIEPDKKKKKGSGSNDSVNGSLQKLKKRDSFCNFILH